MRHILLLAAALLAATWSLPAASADPVIDLVESVVGPPGCKPNCEVELISPPCRPDCEAVGLPVGPPGSGCNPNCLPGLEDPGA